MKKPNPRFEATVSCFSNFYIYLTGFCIFVFDLTLAGYRANFDVVSLRLESKCRISLRTPELKITRPLTEIIVIFTVYSSIFIWIAVYEWLRDWHWEHRIRLDENGLFRDLYEDLISKFPQIPVRMSGFRNGTVVCRDVLRSKHWLFLGDFDKIPKYELSHLVPVFFVTVIQWGILLSSNCFIFGVVSFSNFEIIGIIYAVFHWIQGFLFLGISVVDFFIASRIQRFYSILKSQIDVFLREDRGVNFGDSEEFLEVIGKKGLAYLSITAEVAGFRHFEYLLFLMLGEFMMSKNSKLPNLESWMQMEDESVSTVSDQTRSSKRIESIMSSRRSSTYESFDTLKQDCV